jgi:hypothetical protein
LWSDGTTVTLSNASEAITCNAWYQVSGTSCVIKSKSVTSAVYNGRTFAFTSFVLAYWTPQTKTSSALNIANWTSKLTTTFILWSDGTTVTLSNASEAITCSAWYQVSGANCVAKAPTTTSNRMSWCSTNNYKVWNYEVASCDLSVRARSSTWWCPSGYHLPSDAEWGWIASFWWGDLSIMASKLSLQGCWKYYWTSSLISWVTINGGSAYRVYIPCTWQGVWGIAGNINGVKSQNLVRCFKN